MLLNTKKLEIIIPKDKSRLLLEKFQRLEIVEIISAKPTEKVVLQEENLDFKIAGLNFARDFLKKYEESSGFTEGFLNSKQNFNLNDLKKITEDQKIEEVIQQCQKIETELNNLNSNKEKLNNQKEICDFFSGITLTNEEELENFDYLVGYVSLKKKENLLEDLRKENIIFSIEWADKKEKNVGFSLVYSKEQKEKIEKIVKTNKVGVQEVFWNKPPKESLLEIKQEIENIEKNILKYEKKAKKLSSFIPKIEALIDWYSWEREKNFYLNRGEETNIFFSVLTWVPENYIEFLKKEIKKVSPYFLITEKEIKKEERPPVIIKNKRITKPFESVTNVYGAPHHNDLDPTPYLAPFFALAFALALSDAGYGFILLVGSLIAKMFLKNFSNFLNLMAISGFLTIIAGILTGTVFGTDIASSYRVLDSVQDPLTTMIFTFILGVVQIFIGLVIGMIWDLKTRGVGRGLGDRGASVAFFLGLGLFALYGNFVFILSGLLVMLCLKIFFNQEKKIILKIVKSFGSLYDLVGYFSDVISYSRILALGLATGVIAMVVNIIAFLFKDMMPFEILGWAIALIILIGGHTFNILINSLGSFVHSARLQFVEFFPKFIEGGGRHLKPLNKQGRFIKINN